MRAANSGTQIEIVSQNRVYIGLFGYLLYQKMITFIII